MKAKVVVVEGGVVLAGEGDSEGGGGGNEGVRLPMMVVMMRELGLRALVLWC